jgi:hypothetical protein
MTDRIDGHKPERLYAHCFQAVKVFGKGIEGAFACILTNIDLIYVAAVPGPSGEDLKMPNIVGAYGHNGSRSFDGVLAADDLGEKQANSKQKASHVLKLTNLLQNIEWRNTSVELPVLVHAPARTFQV